MSLQLEVDFKSSVAAADLARTLMSRACVEEA